MVQHIKQCRIERKLPERNTRNTKQAKEETDCEVLAHVEVAAAELAGVVDESRDSDSRAFSQSVTDSMAVSPMEISDDGSKAI